MMHRVLTTSLAVFLPSLVLTGCASGTASHQVAQVAPAAVPAEITAPYTVENGQQIVQLYLNGKGPFGFVFDTGAAGLIVSSALRDQLQLQTAGTDTANSPGGEGFEVEVVTLDAVGLAGAQVSDVEATVMERLPFGVPGVIGPSVFRDYGRFAIDFPKGEMKIGGEVHDWPNKTWIPFGADAPLLDIDLHIGGQIIPAHIDSGAPQALALPEKYEVNMALVAPAVVVGKASTIDRTFDIKEAAIDLSLDIGDARIDLNRVTLFDMPYGNIGFAGLSGLFLEIDWQGRRFALRGNTVQSPKEAPAE